MYGSFQDVKQAVFDRAARARRPTELGAVVGLPPLSAPPTAIHPKNNIPLQPPSNVASKHPMESPSNYAPGSNRKPLAPGPGGIKVKLQSSPFSGFTSYRPPTQLYNQNHPHRQMNHYHVPVQSPSNDVPAAAGQVAVLGAVATAVSFKKERKTHSYNFSCSFEALLYSTHIKDCSV